MKKLLIGILVCVFASTAFAQQDHRSERRVNRGDSPHSQNYTEGVREYDVQREGFRALQQPTERRQFSQERSRRGNWGSRGSRMRGRNEASDQSRGRRNRGREVQNFWMRFRNSQQQPSHRNDERQNFRRGREYNQCPSCRGVESSPRQDPLQRPRRRRN